MSLISEMCIFIFFVHLKTIVIDVSISFEKWRIFTRKLLNKIKTDKWGARKIWLM